MSEETSPPNPLSDLGEGEQEPSADHFAGGGEMVATWGGVFHLLRYRPSAGPETLCGLQLRELMKHDEAEAHGLRLCRFCGEDRG